MLSYTNTTIIRYDESLTYGCVILAAAEDLQARCRLVLSNCALVPACLQLEKNGDTMLKTMDWKNQVQEMQKKQVQKKAIEKCNSERSKHEKWRKHAKQKQIRSETNWTNMISEKREKAKKMRQKMRTEHLHLHFPCVCDLHFFCIVFLHMHVFAFVICTCFCTTWCIFSRLQFSRISSQGANTSIASENYEYKCGTRVLQQPQNGAFLNTEIPRWQMCKWSVCRSYTWRTTSPRVKVP